MSKISIVIPCYNEVKAIPLLIEKCVLACGNRKDVEFLLVDNGSTDQTQSVFSTVLANASYPFIKLITVKKNEGYGNGIIQGLLNASGDILSFTHADLQCDPLDVVRAFDAYSEILLNNRGIVKGKRINRSFVDAFYTWGMSFLSSWMLGVQLADVNAQPKIFHRKFFEKFQNPPKDFSLDLFILYFARKNDFIIETFPVVFSKRHSGEAKGGGSWKGKIRLIKRTFNYILKLRKSVLNK